MRILHFSSALSWRGGEQQIAWLMEELREQRVEQMVLCPTNTPLLQFAKIQNFASASYTKKSSISFSAAKTLKRKAQQFKADIIHVHDSHAHTYAVIAAQFFGCKIPIVLNRRVDFPIGQNMLSSWKYNHKSIKKIICVSDFIKELILPKIKVKDKVCTIHSGIDSEKYNHRASGSLHKLLGLDKSKKLVGNVAAIAPHKDYFTFVDTCKIINQSNPEIAFVIIGGDGGEKEKIIRYIEELGLKENIHLTGFRNDVEHLLPDLDVFLFTSKTEGLGTSLLNALSANVPVVATRAGGIPEIIIPGKSGLLENIADAKALANAVLSILGSDELSERLRSGGKEILQSFSKKETARKVLAAYDEVKSLR